MQTNGDSWESESLLETNETIEDSCDWGRLMENNRDSWESEILVETHETNGDSWDSDKIMMGINEA